MAETIINFDEPSPKSFADFPSVNKSQQIDKIINDLKGKTLQDLQWSVDDAIILDPIYHAEDLPTAFEPLMANRTNNNWEIGTSYFSNDGATTNKLALSALSGGAEALRFVGDDSLSIGAFQAFIKGIELGYISTILKNPSLGMNPEAWIAELLDKGQTKELKLHLSINWLKESSVEAASLGNLFKTYGADFPNLRWIQIDMNASPKDSLVSNLAQLLYEANTYMEYWIEKGISTTELSRRIQIHFTTSNHFFVEIAKYRAFILLWGNLTKAYGALSQSVPLMEATVSFESDLDNNSKMIQASTQALSAIMGGVQRFYAWENEIQDPFYSRIGRNIQHLLKMESKIDLTADPGAGSYYIENITQMLAEAAWKEFQEMV